MTKPLENRIKKTLSVRFFDLEPVLRDDGVDTLSHKNYCPVCHEGMLLMHRSSKTFELLDVDICTLCGQRVYYEDIDLVRQTRP